MDAKNILIEAFNEAGLFTQDEWSEENLSEADKASLAKHDKARHKGHFDPETMTCKFREQLKQGARVEEIKDEIDDDISSGPDISGVEQLGQERKTLEQNNTISPDNTDIKKTEMSLDAEYLDAIKHGNIEKAQKMLFEYAKKVYGDSIIKYANGSPVIFYHGSNSRINIFDPRKDKNGFGDIYFTDNIEYAKKFGKEVNPVILMVNNPSEHDWNKEGFSNALTSRYSGHDAAFVYNVKDFTGIIHNEVLMRDNKNIKSAAPIEYDENGNIIPLSRRFDPKNADVRGNSQNRNTNEAKKYKEHFQKLLSKIRPDLDVAKIIDEISRISDSEDQKNKFLQIINTRSMPNV